MRFRALDFGKKILKFVSLMIVGQILCVVDMLGNTVANVFLILSIFSSCILCD